jgi:hypothetical protein
MTGYPADSPILYYHTKFVSKAGTQPIVPSMIFVTRMSDAPSWSVLRTPPRSLGPTPTSRQGSSASSVATLDRPSRVTYATAAPTAMVSSTCRMRALSISSA